MAEDKSKFGVSLDGLKEEGKKTGLGETGALLLRIIRSEINKIKSNIIDRLIRKTLKWNVTCGVYITQAGSATQEILDDDIEVGDAPIVSLIKVGASPVTRGDYEVQKGKIVITMSGDPGSDHQLSYLVLRHSR